NTPDESEIHQQTERSDREPSSASQYVAEFHISHSAKTRPESKTPSQSASDQCRLPHAGIQYQCGRAACMCGFYSPAVEGPTPTQPSLIAAAGNAPAHNRGPLRWRWILNQFVMGGNRDVHLRRDRCRAVGVPVPGGARGCLSVDAP